MYFTRLIVSLAVFLAAPAFATPYSAAEVKRQVDQTGPLYILITARWRTYNNRYAFVDGTEVVVPVAKATASTFYYDPTSGQLILNKKGEVPLVAGIFTNLTSNVGALRFGPSNGSEDDFQTEFGFDDFGRLTLGGLARWFGCSTLTAAGYRPGINWQFGEGKTTTPDCQPIELHLDVFSKESK